MSKETVSYTAEDLKPKDLTRSQFMYQMRILRQYYEANPTDDPDKLLIGQLDGLKKTLEDIACDGLILRYRSSVIQGLYVQMEGKGRLGYLASLRESGLTENTL